MLLKTTRTCALAALILTITSSIASAQDEATSQLTTCDAGARAATEVVRQTRLPHEDLLALTRAHRRFNARYDHIFSPRYTRDWFASAGLTGGTLTGLRGKAKCSERGTLSGGGSLANYGLVMGIEHRPSNSSLTLTGVGRLDYFLWNYEGTESYNSGAVKWSTGARLQVTRWFAAQWLWGLDRSFWSSKEEVFERVGGTPERHTYQVLGLEVPAIGLGAGVILDDGLRRATFDRLNVTDIPLGQRFLASASLESRRYEQRGKATLQLEYLLGEDAYERMYSSAFKNNLFAEVSLENRDLNFRHARAGVDINMMDMGLRRGTRRDDIGVYLGQRASAHVFHGQFLDEAVGRKWAPGGFYEMYIQLQSGFIFYEVDFGMGINRPGLLEQSPHMLHGGEIKLSMNLSSKF